jgi:hypothetical protein
MGVWWSSCSGSSSPSSSPDKRRLRPLNVLIRRERAPRERSGPVTRRAQQPWGLPRRCRRTVAQRSRLRSGPTRSDPGCAVPSPSKATVCVVMTSSSVCICPQKLEPSRW